MLARFMNIRTCSKKNVIITLLLYDFDTNMANMYLYPLALHIFAHIGMNS